MEYGGKQMPGIQAQAIGRSADEHLTILVSNRTGEPYEPQLMIDGKRYKGRINYRYVADEKLNATNGGNAEMEGSGEVEVRIQEWRGKSTELVIPKNSFGILKVRR
jgi:hypothetical protein